MKLPDIKPVQILAAATIILGLFFVAQSIAESILEPYCYDGAGSAYYIDKSKASFNALDMNFDAEYAGQSYYDQNNKALQDALNQSTVATVSWNCPGTRYTYHISENGTLKNVNVDQYQKYLEDYRQKNPENLIKLYSSGNSPTFISRSDSNYFITKQS